MHVHRCYITLTYSQNDIGYTLHQSPSISGLVATIPMNQAPVLIEPSLADAIAIIGASAELPEQTRRHWATSLRQIAKAFDKPLELIPARYSAICKDLVRLHEVPVGLTVKTLRNHKSNTKSALLWLAREKDVPRYGAPLTPPWEALQVQIGNSRIRHRLSSFIRYCSAKQITPVDVDEAVVDCFMDYRRRCGMRADNAFRRLMARAWNSNVGVVRGWPARPLVEPPAKQQVELVWESFPEGLRRDIDGYLESLTRIRRSQTGLRIRPLRQVTISTRRAELLAAVRMAVKSGLPADTLKSLGALLAPEVAEKILDAYWRRNGEEPATYTIDLAKRFFAIAKETKCVDDAACDRLDEMRASLEAHRRDGLTDKNSALIQKVLTPGVWKSGRQVALRNDDFCPRLRRAFAYQSRCHGPACGGNRHPFRGAGALGQSDGHQTWLQPDQARWPRVELLAGLPGL